jgi:hypothetical protein
LTDYGKPEYELGEEVFIKAAGKKGLIIGHTIERNHEYPGFTRLYDLKFRDGHNFEIFWGFGVAEYLTPRYGTFRTTADQLEPLPDQQTFWDERF